MLTFEWPWLAAVLPLPFLVRWLLRPANPQQAALTVPFIEDFVDQSTTPSLRVTQQRLTLLLAILAWLALVTAATRPVWYGEPVANEFIRQRAGDRVGLILFGSRAYLQAPLTFDRQTVSQLLDEALINIAGEKTAIGDAIGLAIKRLRDKTGDRLLILLTDGENTAGAMPPLKAAELAAQLGLKIYTIGIGPDRRAGNSFFGMMRGRRSGFDEQTLQLIARQTGGQYFHASNTRELAGVYKQIDALEPVESDVRVYRPRQSLFYWPLGIALALFCIALASRSLSGKYQ
jgi:Ca-activated chloride channel family protein